MEAISINNIQLSGSSPSEVIDAFFKVCSLDTAQVYFWKIFQCWTLKDCSVKAETSDQEIALFLDQLISLVAAAQILHEANRVSTNQKGGESHVS